MTKGGKHNIKTVRRYCYCYAIIAVFLLYGEMYSL